MADFCEIRSALDGFAALVAAWRAFEGPFGRLDGCLFEAPCSSATALIANENVPAWFRNALLWSRLEAHLDMGRWPFPNPISVSKLAPLFAVCPSICLSLSLSVYLTVYLVSKCVRPFSASPLGAPEMGFSKCGQASEREPADSSLLTALPSPVPSGKLFLDSTSHQRFACRPRATPASSSSPSTQSQPQT